MQVYQGVVVTKENAAGVPVGVSGVVVGAADPVAVKFEGIDGKQVIVEIEADALRVL